MYKLLIVEDEDFIRNALVSNIDWNSIGFEVQDAPDGEIALEVAKEFKPDALLTDIRMPFIDGLELIPLLKSDFPDLVVVVVSGHDEFEYAQSALKKGVRDYLLKPVRASQLEKTMLEVKKDIDMRLQKEKKMQQLKAQLNQSLPVLQESYLSRILENSFFKEESILKELDFLQIQLRGTAYIVCVFAYSERDDQKPEIEDEYLLDFAIHNALSEEFGTDARCIRDSRGNHVIIYCKRSREQAERLFVYDCVYGIKNSVETAFKITLTAGIGFQVDQLSSLPKSYSSALEALSQQVLMGKGKVYDIMDHVEGQMPMVMPIEYIENLLLSIKFETIETILTETDKLFEHLRQHRYTDLNGLRLVLAEIIVGTQKIMLEFKCDDFDLFSKIYQKIYQCDTIEALYVMLVDFLSTIKQKLDEMRSSNSVLLIDRACHIINQQFSDPELSLRNVAQQVYVTPSYLSTLFKRVLGSTFVDYITNLRMEKAKELLSSGMHKTFEVATIVGYTDPQYFSSRFKRFVGYTPSEYKKSKGQ